MKAFILANLSDAVSTATGLAAGAREANPVINMVMESAGVPEALLLKLAVAVGVGLVINRWKPRLLNIPTLAFALIAIGNSMSALSYA
jgi:hypothetical protein